MRGGASVLLLVAGLALALLAFEGRHALASPLYGDALRWLSGPTVGEPLALIGLGADGRSLVRVRGGRLESVPLAGQKAARPITLPRAAWTSLHLAPVTDGEVERALLVARARPGQPSRLLLVHLRTGRVIADWKDEVALGRDHDHDHEPTILWAPDGRRFATIGWSLGHGAAPDELAVRWVDAGLGAVLARVEVPGLLASPSQGAAGKGEALQLTSGAAARAAVLGDGRSLVLEVGPRLVVLGPGPIDARTIAPPSGSRLLGRVEAGLVLWRRERLLLVDPDSGSRAEILAEINVDGGFGTRAQLVVGQRFGLVSSADGGALHLVDFRRREARPFDALGARPLMAADRVVLLGRSRLGLLDLLRFLP